MKEYEKMLIVAAIILTVVIFCLTAPIIIKTIALGIIYALYITVYFLLKG